MFIYSINFSGNHHQHQSYFFYTVGGGGDGDGDPGGCVVTSLSSINRFNLFIRKFSFCEMTSLNFIHTLKS